MKYSASTKPSLYTRDISVKSQKGNDRTWVQEKSPWWPWTAILSLALSKTLTNSSWELQHCDGQQQWTELRSKRGVCKCFNAKCIDILSDAFNYQHQHKESQALACKCVVTTPAGTLWLLSSQQRCIATCNETSTLPDEMSTLQPHWHCQTQCAFSSSLECSSKETIFCPKRLVHQRSTFDICVLSWSIMTLLHP